MLQTVDKNKYRFLKQLGVLHCASFNCHKGNFDVIVSAISSLQNRQPSDKILERCPPLKYSTEVWQVLALNAHHRELSLSEGDTCKVKE